jgi:hypothetical protein
MYWFSADFIICMCIDAELEKLAVNPWCAP